MTAVSGSGAVIVIAAADACGIRPSVGRNSAAVDGDSAGVSACAHTADPRAGFLACDSQRAGAVNDDGRVNGHMQPCSSTTSLISKFQLIASFQRQIHR